jgi:hypothetical protein
LSVVAQGIEGTQPLDETVPNLFIDVTCAAGALLYLRQETKAEEVVSLSFTNVTRCGSQALFPKFERLYK